MSRLLRLEVERKGRLARGFEVSVTNTNMAPAQFGCAESVYTLALAEIFVSLSALGVL